MILSTLSTYDMEKYEIIGPVSGMSVHGISFFRNIFAGFSSLFGGKQSAIQEKFMDVRREALKDMSKAAKNAGADMVGGLTIELSELGQEYVLCLATGTALRDVSKKNASKKKNTELLLTLQNK